MKKTASLNIIASLIASDNKEIDRVIGINGDLAVHIPEDMKFFRRMTRKSIIVMGSKTWNSLPVRPLKDRTNIVLTTRPESLTERKYCIPMTIQDFLYMKDNILTGNIWCIGGGKIYSKLIDYADCLILTKVFADIKLNKTDEITKFPDYSDWKLISEMKREKTDKSPAYSFCKFLKLKK